MTWSCIFASEGRGRLLFGAVLGAVLVGAVAGCATLSPVAASPPSLVISENLGEIKQALVVYHDNGLYNQQLAAVDRSAREYLLARADKVKKPALVLDIDETSLSNWPEIRANDFAYFPGGELRCDKLPSGPCGPYQWDLLAKAQAIGPTLDLFNAAKALGVAVFFITGRHAYGAGDDETEATQANLTKAGYADWAGLSLRSAEYKTATTSSYKASERKKIEERGYTIIANVGDQPSDLAGGYAERTFLLPNPFYRIN